ncbi:hypothetical protein ACQKM9_01440 [Viridibacillus sp. NPDC093762]|uniref:hypothetical protein n=1 Tax=Viridibacillus sp. NPDC093762 TaxID=3390720 RepID=UPI003D06BB9D
MATGRLSDHETVEQLKPQAICKEWFVVFDYIISSLLATLANNKVGSFIRISAKKMDNIVFTSSVVPYATIDLFNKIVCNSLPHFI